MRRSPARPRAVGLPAIEPLVRAATELRCYGWTWCGLGLVLVVATVGAGLLADLKGVTIGMAATLLGISLGAMLGTLVLGRRTDVRILYVRIFERAPEPPPGVPVETPGRTATRVVPPAALSALALVVIAPVAMAFMLAVVGIGRDELSEQLPAAMLVSAGWTLTAGAVALRVAGYFTGWERRRDRAILCPPLRAGALRPVYRAAPVTAADSPSRCAS